MAQSNAFQKSSQAKCLHCKFETNDENQFLIHVKIHVHEKNFRIPCFYCPTVVRELKYYRKHLKSCRRSLKEPIPQQEKLSENGPRWHCKLCDVKIMVQIIPSIKDFTAVTKHLFKHAKTEKVFCPECEKPFHSYQYFVNHVNRHKTREEFNLKGTLNNHIGFPQSDQIVQDLFIPEQEFPFDDLSIEHDEENETEGCFTLNSNIFTITFCKILSMALKINIDKMCLNIQPRNFTYIRLLNKPYENEVFLRGQNPSSKCC